MNRVLSASILALGCTVAVAAQGGAADQAKDKMSKEAPKEVAVTGCVAESGGHFMLNNATMASQTTPMSYELSGGTLKPHVGHKVEITGTIKTAAMKKDTPSKDTMAKDTMAKAGDMKKSDMTSAGFSFLGCAPEERTDPTGLKGRTLSGTLYADDALTEEKCMAFCTSKGYKYAGTEYARECWCGNSYPPSRQPGTTKASLAGCSKRCSGNAAQFCGGSDWLSLYQACVGGGACVNAVFT